MAQSLTTEQSRELEDTLFRTDQDSLRQNLLSICDTDHQFARVLYNVLVGGGDDDDSSNSDGSTRDNSVELVEQDGNSHSVPNSKISPSTNRANSHGNGTSNGSTSNNGNSITLPSFATLDSSLNHHQRNKRKSPSDSEPDPASATGNGGDLTNKRLKCFTGNQIAYCLNCAKECIMDDPDTVNEPCRFHSGDLEFDEDGEFEEDECHDTESDEAKLNAPEAYKWDCCGRLGDDPYTCQTKKHRFGAGYSNSFASLQMSRESMGIPMPVAQMEPVRRMPESARAVVSKYINYIDLT